MASTDTKVNFVTLNAYKTTTTYDYKLKDGTVAMTSKVATSTTSMNGYGNGATASDATTYTIKKISVPSSRQAAVMEDTFKKQNDMGPGAAVGSWATVIQNDLKKFNSELEHN